MTSYGWILWIRGEESTLNHLNHVSSIFSDFNLRVYTIHSCHSRQKYIWLFMLYLGSKAELTNLKQSVVQCLREFKMRPFVSRWVFCSKGEVACSKRRSWLNILHIAIHGYCSLVICCTCFTLIFSTRRMELCYEKLDSKAIDTVERDHQMDMIKNCEMEIARIK